MALGEIALFARANFALASIIISIHFTQSQIKKTQSAKRYRITFLRLGTPWHALARLGTPWHALTRLGTPWHALALWYRSLPARDDCLERILVDYEIITEAIAISLESHRFQFASEIIHFRIAPLIFHHLEESE